MIVIVNVIVDVISVLSFSSVGYHIEFIIVGIWRCLCSNRWWPRLQWKKLRELLVVRGNNSNLLWINWTWDKVVHTPILLLLDGAHGSTTAVFDADVCQESVGSGALLSHGSCGLSGVSHGSLDCAAFDAKLPLAAALFCSQPSFDEPADAIDGEWLRAIQFSTLLVAPALPAANDDTGCLDIAPVFDCHGSVAGDELLRPHGSGAW